MQKKGQSLDSTFEALLGVLKGIRKSPLGRLSENMKSQLLYKLADLCQVVSARKDIVPKGREVEIANKVLRGATSLTPIGAGLHPIFVDFVCLMAGRERAARLINRIGWAEVNLPGTAQSVVVDKQLAEMIGNPKWDAIPVIHVNRPSDIEKIMGAPLEVLMTQEGGVGSLNDLLNMIGFPSSFSRCGGCGGRCSCSGN